MKSKEGSEQKIRCKEKIASDEDIQDKKNEYPFLFHFQITEKESLIRRNVIFFFLFSKQKIDVSHIMT